MQTSRATSRLRAARLASSWLKTQVARWAREGPAISSSESRRALGSGIHIRGELNCRLPMRPSRAWQMPRSRLPRPFGRAETTSVPDEDGIERAECAAHRVTAGLGLGLGPFTPLRVVNAARLDTTRLAHSKYTSSFCCRLPQLIPQPNSYARHLIGAGSRVKGEPYARCTAEPATLRYR